MREKVFNNGKFFLRYREKDRKVVADKTILTLVLELGRNEGLRLSFIDYYDIRYGVVVTQEGQVFISTKKMQDEYEVLLKEMQQDLAKQFYFIF